MHKPTVSVVTPTYDRRKYLLSAIKTVREQTYPYIEHVIVDDASPTPVSDFLPAERSDLIIHRHDTNRGANIARNTGIDLASGEYVAFLDDDDKWKSSKISRQVDVAERTDAGAVYTGVEQELNGQIVSTQTPDLSGKITKDLLTGAPLNSTSTIMFCSDVFDQVRGFDEKLPINQDWEFYIRASTVTNFAAVSDPLVTRRHHGSQISDDYIGKRDIAVPRMLNKHLELAAQHDVERDFKSALQSSLGGTAVRTGHWNAARLHYLRSLRLSPSKQAGLRLLALTLGRWSYIPAQKLRRALA